MLNILRTLIIVANKSLQAMCVSVLKINTHYFLLWFKPFLKVFSYLVEHLTSVASLSAFDGVTDCFSNTFFRVNRNLSMSDIILSGSIKCFLC